MRKLIAVFVIIIITYSFAQAAMVKARNNEILIYNTLSRNAIVITNNNVAIGKDTANSKLDVLGQIRGSSLSITGTTTANLFKGNIIGNITGNLTGTATTASVALNSLLLDSNNSAYYRNASNINAGTIADTYLPINITSTCDKSLTANNASNSWLLNGQAGSYYLNASNINAGTIADTYLPDNITATASKALTANNASNSWLLNNQNSNYYRSATNINAGTLDSARLSSNILTNPYTGNLVLGTGHTISGTATGYLVHGLSHILDSTAQASIILGGMTNRTAGTSTAIIGGEDNRIIGQSLYSIMLGGLSSTINTSVACSIIGGAYNGIGYNSDNSIVLGGYGSFVDGSGSAMINGFQGRVVGNYSFGVGRVVNISHNGATVINDGTGNQYNSNGDNSFSVKATGGIYLADAVSINSTLTVQSTANINAVTIRNVLDLMPLTVTPSATEGRIFYNGTSKKILLYNGSAWTDLN